jgi:flagellar basal body rod protein FlgG
MKQAVFIILLTVAFSVYANADQNLIHTYKNLYHDLTYSNTYGYKSYPLPDLYKMQYATLFKQGSLHITENRFDFAIVGEGFFKVWDETNNRIYYTRNGEFTINTDEYLVQRNGGYKLLPLIKVNMMATKCELSDPDLLKFYEWDKSEQSKSVQTYSFELFMPKDNTAIERVNGIYFDFEATVTLKNLILEDIKIMQGVLEMSDVCVIHTLSSMLVILKKMQRLKMAIPELDTKIYFLQHLIPEVVKRLDELKHYGRYLKNQKYIKEKLDQILTMLSSANEGDKQPAAAASEEQREKQNLSSMLLELNKNFEYELDSFFLLNNWYRAIADMLPFLALEYTIRE